MATPPHTALRVPVPGDGAGNRSWGGVVCTADETPILLADPEAYLSQVGDAAHVALDSLDFGSMCHLSRYLPQLLSSEAPLRVAIRAAVARHAPAGAALAVEAGCSVGPDLLTLRDAAEAVIAWDTHIAAVRAARAWVAGLPVAVPIRHEGRRFSWGQTIERAPRSGLHVVVGDVLDPPVHAEVADIVLAANILDNVVDPVACLGQLDAIARPGALMVLTTPLSWHEAITPPQAQLGGGSVPALRALGDSAAVVALLRGQTPLLPHLAWEILEQQDVPWIVRDHDRASYHYSVHVIAARKARRSP